MTQHGRALADAAVARYGSWAPALRAIDAGTALRFVTVAVDQRGGGSAGQLDVRASGQWVPVLDGRRNHTGGDEPVEPAGAARAPRDRGNQFRNDASMSGDDHPLARLDTAEVTAEVVFQLRTPVSMP